MIRFAVLVVGALGSGWNITKARLVTDKLTPSLSDCPPGTKACEYKPGQVACCTSGESCVPGIGCRCMGKDCEVTGKLTPSLSDCPPGTKACEYNPGQVACCTNGEACIPGIGCRCMGKDCAATGKLTPSLSDCPPGTKACEYSPGQVACCTNGESCIPGIGCRCMGKDCAVTSKQLTPSLSDCPPGTKACEYSPGKVACCTNGESCVPGIGCRCMSKDCAVTSKLTPPLSDCPPGTKACEYSPGKVACCTNGESCVPGIGCRCMSKDCAVTSKLTPSLSDCPPGTKACEYSPGKVACCTSGESCVPGIGCRCMGKNCAAPFGNRPEVTANPTPSLSDCPPGTKTCEYNPGQVACCTSGESCIPGIGCRCMGNCAAPTPGVFGNPPEDCKYGALIEGPTKNNTLQVTIVSYNVQGWAQQPQNVGKQAELLRSFSPDFIATQEDMYGWDMQQQLGEGAWCFVGETRDGRSCSPSCPAKVPLSKNGGDGEHTFIYYKCKVWQLLETGTYYMGNFANDGYPRIFTNARFQHYETLQQIWVTSTHFPKKQAVAGQQVCIQDLLTMGDEWRGMSIILGDFNIVESTTPSPLYKPLKDNRFTFDSFDACSACRLCHNGYDKHFSTFAGHDLFCDDAHPEISDHYPIVGTYDI